MPGLSEKKEEGLMSKRNSVTTGQVKQIRELYLRGDKIDDIAAAIGVKKPVIYTYTKDLPKRNARIPDDVRAGLVKDYREGVLSIDQICEKHGVAMSSLYNILRSRACGPDRDRLRSVMIRLEIDEARMLIGMTKDIKALDRVTQELRRALEVTQNGKRRTDYGVAALREL